MTDEERVAETRRWLRQASEDLRVAEMAARGEDVAPHVACYLSQQAAEKALKAVLIFLQIEFEKRRQLDELRNLIPSSWPVRQEHPSLEGLSQWAVKARYPGDWFDPTEADAQAALRQARGVWDSVVRDLADHGFHPQEQR